MFNQDAAIEKLLQAEQEAITRIVEDAVTVLGNASQQTHDWEIAKAALRRRSEKLSLAARITARVLTKVILNSKYPH